MSRNPKGERRTSDVDSGVGSRVPVRDENGGGGEFSGKREGLQRRKGSIPLFVVVCWEEGKAHPVVPVPPTGDETKARVDEAGGEGDCAGKASVKGEKERLRREGSPTPPPTGRAAAISPRMIMTLKTTVPMTYTAPEKGKD